MSFGCKCRVYVWMQTYTQLISNRTPSSSSLKARMCFGIHDTRFTAKCTLSHNCPSSDLYPVWTPLPFLVFVFPSHFFPDIDSLIYILVVGGGRILPQLYNMYSQRQKFSVSRLRVMVENIYFIFSWMRRVIVFLFSFDYKPTEETFKSYSRRNYIWSQFTTSYGRGDRN